MPKDFHTIAKSQSSDLQVDYQSGAHPLKGRSGPTTWMYTLLSKNYGHVMKDHLTDMLDCKPEENRICKSSYSKFLIFFEWTTVTRDPDISLD